MNKTGFAILGLDHWYAAFDIAEQIRRSQHARLIAVSHDDAARAEKFAADYGAEFHSTDFRAALERPGVDIVVTLRSIDCNPESCLAAAQLGKHIISIKPMAMTVELAHTIADAIKQARVNFFPLEALGRMNPDRIRLKQWLAEGRIGDVVRYFQSMQSTLPLDWPGGEHNGGWWVDPKRAPGGGWLDHAVYAIDTARWLFGSEPASVSGYAANLRQPSIQLEDYGAATFTFKNGAVAVIEDTWTSKPGFFLARNEMIGSEGAVIEDGGVWGRRVAVRGNFGFDGWTVVEHVRGDGVSVVDHAVSCARGETQPVATVDDGVANLRYCLEFYRAAKEGRTLSL